MTTLRKTISIELPDGTILEVDIELDVIFSPGTPGSASDPQGWEPLNIRLADE